MSCNQSNFYVYQLEDPTTAVVFYVGIAKITKHCPKGFRPKRHIQEAVKYRERQPTKTPNKHKLHSILRILDAGLTPTINITFENLTQDEAEAKEKELIAHYGRADQGRGTLANLTDGGEGCFNMSEDGRRRVGAATKARPCPTKGKVLGAYSAERRANIGAASGAARKGKPRKKGIEPVNKGKEMNEAFKQKMRDAWVKRKAKWGNKGRPTTSSTVAGAPKSEV